jgi:hypothetical protein
VTINIGMTFRTTYEIITETKQSSQDLLMKRYPNDTRIQNEIMALDQTPSKGDVPSLIKFFNYSKNLNILKGYVSKYYLLKKKNKIQGMTLFKDFISFTEKIDSLEQTTNLEAPEKVDVVGEDILVDNENIQIIKTDNVNKCIRYGRGYSFCISRQAGGNMYNNYRLSKQSSFYFIFFKKTPKTNPEHIMVLDNNDKGYEWTFADNNTEQTSWQEIVTKFPILKEYKNLFQHQELTQGEMTNLETLDAMNYMAIEEQLATFKTLPYSVKGDFLKTQVDLRDEIFVELDKNLRNDFISIGPNLTVKQVKALTSTEKARYLETRKISVPQLLSHYLYDFNELDISLPLVQKKEQEESESLKLALEDHDNDAYHKFEITNYNFLHKLADMSKMKFHHITIESCPLMSLQGMPEEITGSLRMRNLSQLTTLKGCPRKVDTLSIYECSNLKNLKYCPQEMDSFQFSTDIDDFSFEGMPERLLGDLGLAGDFKDMKYLPKHVGGYFNCPDGDFASFEGHPLYIGEYMQFQGSKITELNSVPFFKRMFLRIKGDMTNVTDISSLLPDEDVCFEFLNDNMVGIPHRLYKGRAQTLIAESYQKWQKYREKYNENFIFDKTYNLILEKIRS